MVINIGSDIKAVRTLLELTQQEFANLFNSMDPRDIRTNQVDISKYEKNINRCPAEKYVKFLSLENLKRLKK